MPLVSAELFQNGAVVKSGFACELQQEHHICLEFGVREGNPLLNRIVLSL